MEENQIASKKPRITKKGVADQRSIKNSVNMKNARQHLQDYIKNGKQKLKKEKPEVEDGVEEEEEEEEDIEVIFKHPTPEKSVPKEEKEIQKESKKNKLKVERIAFEELIGKYHSELQRLSDKNKKLKKEKKNNENLRMSQPPPPPPPSPSSSIGDTLRKKFLLRF